MLLAEFAAISYCYPLQQRFLIRVRFARGKRSGVDIAIAHVETHGYTLDHPDRFPLLVKESKVYGLWLSGDCYA